MTTTVTGSPVVEVEVGGSREALLLDTGSSGGIAMPESMCARVHGRSGEVLAMGTGDAGAAYLGGEEETITVRSVERLRLGSINFDNWPVVVSPEVGMLRAGMGLMRHFAVTLDWPRARVGLAPRVDVREMKPKLETTGFSVAMQEGTLVVSFLWRGSPADRAGLRLGDRVLSVDDTRLDRPAFDDFCTIAGDLAERSDPVQLTVSRESATRSFTRPEPLLR